MSSTTSQTMLALGNLERETKIRVRKQRECVYSWLMMCTFQTEGEDIGNQ